MSDEQTTLRDTLTAAFDAVETREQETPSETEQRLRDERGRFAKAETEPEAPAEVPKTETQVAPPVEPEAPATPALPRPSSWKKDYWDRWERFEKEDRPFAEYLLQREQQFASGVSTYKAELDNLKPIADAIQPFVPELQQYGIKPTEWIQNLGNAHRTLALGSPEQKVYAFAKLAKDYGVPLEQMFVTGGDGQVYLNQQIQQIQAQASQPAQPQQDVRAVVAQLLAEERMQQEVRAMQSNANDYPHFEAVRETMAGLLSAGLAPDLKSAYETAIALPQHAEIREAMQQQQRQQEEAKRAAEAAAATKRAKANAVSVRTATPSGAAPVGTKDRRAVLAEALEQHLGGRV